jgi:hypothetical protein
MLILPSAADLARIEAIVNAAADSLAEFVGTRVEVATSPHRVEVRGPHPLVWQVMLELREAGVYTAWLEIPDNPRLPCTAGVWTYPANATTTVRSSLA